ncbi:hypothetical protein MRS44_003767 [Fusarium solani]|uniref:uncharacterized protein n=1 Tax=Fusarium solani TaxID=169388 RepID=UPI0032C43BF2|nr:hypothetical protein MRS44_003767 [Fusarium solani]
MPAHLHLAALRTPNPFSLFLSALCNASMASATFDSEQRKLRQSLTPPASQPDTVSLQKKKALSAPGKSSDTAICIPSDVESDTEDENDDSRELNNLQSCATRASTPDYLDLTGTEHGATELEVAIGVVTAPIVSLAQAEAALAWPSETQVSHLADAEPSQKSCCKINHVLTGDASASQDINFATPPTSPESEPYSVAADGQELRPVPVRSSGLPSTCTHSPRTTSPVEVTQASLEASEAPAGSSHDDAISEAHTPSPARASAEPHQAQVLGDAASELAEARFESPSEARVSSPSPSPRRSRRISMQIHKTMQSKDGDADSEGSESEDGLNYRDKNSPSLVDSGDSNSEDGDADGSHQGRKRRKVLKSVSCSVRSTADSSRGSRNSRQRRSTTHATQLPSAIRTSGRDIDSPTPSQVTPAPSGANMFLARSVSNPKKRRSLSKTLRSVAKSSGARWTSEEDETVRRMKQDGDSWAAIQRALPPHRSEGTIQVRSIPSEASAFLARFQEWPLENVSMKRITENGKTTFQFQFEWPLFTNHVHVNDEISDSTHSVTTRKTRRRAPARRAKYSDDEDNFLIQLKEEEQLEWAEIRRRFAKRFPERGGSGLQVHYCTKLKNRGRT